MKKILVLIILFCYTFIVQNAKAEDGPNHHLIFEVNGHQHFFEDSLYINIVNNWDKNYSDFVKKVKEKVKDKLGFSPNTFELGRKISKLDFVYDDATDETTIVLRINNNIVQYKKSILRWSVWGWKPTVFYKVGIKFDILIKAKTEIAVDTLKINQKIKSTKIEFLNMKNVSNFIGFMGGGAFLSILEFADAHFALKLDDLVGKKFTFLNLGNDRFGSYVGNDEIGDVEALKNSLSISLAISTKKNKTNFPDLMIKVDFLKDYWYPSNTFHDFSNYVPDQLDNPLQYAGFSYNHWDKFDDIKKSDPTLTKPQRFDILLNHMQTMDLNQIRIEAQWNKIVPTVDNISPTLDHNSIIRQNIIDYEGEIETNGGWVMMDQFVTSMNNNTNLLKRIVGLGIGHSSRPPGYIVGADTLILAPGTYVGASDSADYIAVPENVYLYWLKMYAWAVVYHYRDQVSVWQAENELNAAKFGELWGWWRRGDAWRDDSVGGFQDQVAEMLYNIIKSEQPGYTSQVVQAFHVLQSARRIEEWSPYYDVVGLHIYPHLTSPKPPVGFMTGEYVWAARRILKALGGEHQNKPVWILETGYGGAGPNPEPALNGYTEDRQAKYLSDALMSADLYGAQGFCWFTIQTGDVPDSGQDLELERTNGYSGFIRPDDQQKPAYATYVNTFGQLKDGLDVTFFNKQGPDTLGGSFNINGILNNLPSGATIKLNSVDEFGIRENNQFLDNNDSTLLFQHQEWNGDILKHKLVNYQTFTNDPTTTANFKNTVLITFQTNITSIDDHEVIKNIKVRDPWLVDGMGTQSNKLLELNTTSDTTFYKTFMDMEPDVADTSKPYYSIRAPEVVYYDTDRNDVAVFDSWEAVQDAEIRTDPRGGAPYQKAVVITGPNPIVKANYFENIVIENGGIQFEPPWSADNSNTWSELFLKSPVALATPDSLYQIQEWKSYMADGVTEDNTRVTFQTEYYPDGEEVNSWRSIVINKPNTVIKPSFKSVNQIEDYELFLHNGEDLNILDPGEIEFAEGFKIRAGNVSSYTSELYETPIRIIGSPNKEIVLRRTGKNSQHYDSGLISIWNDGYSYPDDSLLCRLEYVRFKDFDSIDSSDYGTINFGVDIIIGIGDGSTTVYEGHQNFYMKNCVFDNSNSAIKINDQYTNDLKTIVNTVFYKTKINITAVDGKVSFYNCIFYETEFEYGSEYGIDEISNSLFYNMGDVSAYTSKGVNNIIDDPLFVDAPTGNFRLQWGSPCINAGLSNYPDHLNRLQTNTDPDGTVPDIGAYYYAQFTDSLYEDNVTISGEARITSDFNVQAGKTLTITPGTTILLDKNVNIDVDGALIAQGTASDSIIFTTLTANPTSSDYWSGITIYEGADSTNPVKYCRIENSGNGITIRNNTEVSNNFIRNISSKGIYSYKSTAPIKNNKIDNFGYAGIYAARTDYVTGELEILNNQISNGGTYGIRLYYASPAIRDNEVSGSTYGVYCYKSSPYLGGFSGYGNNYLHDNTYGLKAYQSSPFLGEEFCDINGGNNWIANNSSYNIYAYSSSTVMAEENWWGASPPQSSKFYTASSSSIDYTPYLTSSPSFNMMASPEQSIFDIALGKISATSTSTDSSLTEEEAMANFDQNWPVSRKLKFARNLVSLNFMEKAYKICKDIIKTEPEMMYSYLAFSIMWKSGNLSDSEYQKFRTYTDSLGRLQDQNELEEYAEFVDQEYDEDEGFGKTSSVLAYKKFTNKTIAANVLFSELENNLINKNDEKKALEVFSIMNSEFPDEPETQEAALLLGLIDGTDIGEEGLLPLKYELAHNYPNPFNATTTFKFGLPKASNVKIEIFNTIGQKVKTIKLKNVAAGYHKQLWKGTNDFGNVVATGMYIYKFTVTSLTDKKVKFQKTRKMILLK
jgi:FlgD Ig-like domain